MADVDIDPFGEHDRTESRTDEPRMNIFFSFQEAPEEPCSTE